MKDLIQQQSNQIEKLQTELNEQKLIFDFQKCEEESKHKERHSKPPAIVVNHKGEAC